MNVAALREARPEPPVPMELDWSDVEAVTPIVFVGGYRDAARTISSPRAEPPGCPECYGGPCVYCSPGHVEPPPAWFVSLPRALFDFIALA